MLSRLSTHNNASLERAYLRKRYITRIAWSGLYAKVTTIIVSLAMIPLAVNYLGSSAYGVWVAIVSLFTLLSGGVGKAIINRISYYYLCGWQFYGVGHFH
ncbi:MAG: hypothetical protein R8K21_09210 [Mariprofundales bacterium]